jgi:hypothetical protein
MKIILSRKSPILFAARLALVAGVGLVGSQGYAAPRAGAYVASLAAPLASPKQEIIGGVMWKCAGESCSAPAEGSRPLLVCERVVKKFGAVSRFASPEGELSAEELTRCNGAA